MSCVRLPGVEGVLGVSVEEAGLPHPGVAQSQELDQVVVVHLSSGSQLCSKYDNVVIQLLISLSIFVRLSVSQVL